MGRGGVANAVPTLIGGPAAQEAARRMSAPRWLAPGTQPGHRPPRLPGTSLYDWRPQGDSNPCYRRERALCRNLKRLIVATRRWVTKEAGTR